MCKISIYLYSQLICEYILYKQFWIIYTVLGKRTLWKQIANFLGIIDNNLNNQSRENWIIWDVVKYNQVCYCLFRLNAGNSVINILHNNSTLLAYLALYGSNYYNNCNWKQLNNRFDVSFRTLISRKHVFLRMWYSLINWAIIYKKYY